MKQMTEFERAEALVGELLSEGWDADDIWNNCYEWRPRAVCSPGDPCHVRAPRVNHEGLQGVGRFKQHRAVLHPSEMSYHYKGKQRDSLHPFDMKQETGWGKAAERAIVPAKLCEEILIACEKGGVSNQSPLG
jgi:hypothetical protein